MDDTLIELSQREVLGLIFLLMLLVVPIGVSMIPINGTAEKTPPMVALQAQMGLEKLNSGLFFIVIILWGAIFGTLIVGLLAVLWELISSQAPSPSNTSDVWSWRFSMVKLTALAATLGAVVALPLTLVRLGLTHRQTFASEQGMITDRINKAVEGLGATSKEIQGTTHPIIEIRLGAIFSLERIAKDSQRDTETISKILTAYIKENASGRKMNFAKARTSSVFLNKEFLRTDVDAAFNVIALLRKNSDRGIKTLDLAASSFETLLMFGINLNQFDFRGSSFKGSVLSRCRATGSNFLLVDFSAANLTDTVLTGTNLSSITVSSETIFTGAKLRGAMFQNSDLSSLSLVAGTLDDCYGDRSVKLPKGFKRPRHWSKRRLSLEKFHRSSRRYNVHIGYDPAPPQ